MSNIIYRAAREDELPATLDLFLQAVAELSMRNNLTQSLAPRAGTEAVYRHIFETGIFRVAELDGKLVGICHAVVRDELWFLSGFWARPGMQARGGSSFLARETQTRRATGETRRAAHRLLLF